MDIFKGANMAHFNPYQTSSYKSFDFKYGVWLFMFQETRTLQGLSWNRLMEVSPPVMFTVNRSLN
jgi:hypothetical protein